MEAAPRPACCEPIGDRGVQSLFIRYGERLAAAGIEGSVDREGNSDSDSDDDALAESVIGLYKTEAMRPGGPCKGLEGVELATLDWVHWSTNRRLLESIGYGILPRSSHPRPDGVTRANEFPMKSGRFRA